MKLRICHQPSLPPSLSPYRLLDEQSREITWANTFLDTLRVRQLSPRSLRAYAFDLLHFARWALASPPHPLAELTQSALLDYLRHQLDQQSPPSTATVNRRLLVIHCLFRFHHGREIPSGQSHLQRTFIQRSALGYGRPRTAITRRLRLKHSSPLVEPLTAAQVSRFWNSFRTFRDLAIVGLMLLDGLRSCEVLALTLHDLRLPESNFYVTGKGNRQRKLPLPPEIRSVLEKYLLLERPTSHSPALFLSLKGPHRGLPLSLSGLRSLFRHHRSRSQVPLANPHRFRHTFGTDMIRAGISLPALQKLMGHASIHTTMLYVQLCPQDVWREYANAVQQRLSLDTSLDTSPVP